jgi:hypothetical protein
MNNRPSIPDSPKDGMLSSTISELVGGEIGRMILFGLGFTFENLKSCCEQERHVLYVRMLLHHHVGQTSLPIDREVTEVCLTGRFGLLTQKLIIGKLLWISRCQSSIADTSGIELDRLRLRERKPFSAPHKMVLD